MRSRFLCILLVSAVLVSSGSEALAGPPAGQRGAAGAPAKPKDRADELFDQATAAFDAGRLAEAEAKFEEAWGLKQTHDIAGNLGITKLQLKKNREAAQHLAWALQHMPPTEASSTRKGLERELQRARAEVSALRVRVNVDGASLTVNGRAAGVSPLDGEVFVDPGPVHIVAQRDGYVAAQQSTLVSKGEAREITLSLVPLVTEKRSIVPGVVLASAAGVALVSGIALTVVSKGKYADAKGISDAIAKGGHTCIKGASDYDARCAELLNTASTSDTMHNAGVGLFIGAAATAAGALTYFLWPAPSPRAGSASMRVVPQASATGGGLVVSGAF